MPAADGRGALAWPAVPGGDGSERALPCAEQHNREGHQQKRLPDRAVDNAEKAEQGAAAAAGAGERDRSDSATRRSLTQVSDRAAHREVHLGAAALRRPRSLHSHLYI